jgi:ABC-type multidrug transport system fused ATPase/permease subunit
MPYYYPIDYFDWALLGYHVSLAILAIVAIRLYALALQHVPSRRYRRRLAREQYGSLATVRAMIGEGFSLPRLGTSDQSSSEEISMDFVRQSEDKLRLSLGHSIRAAGWLQMLRKGLSILICVAITCAAIQGLGRLSTEKQPPPWAYHEVLTSVLLQVLWGLPFLIAVFLLDASCSIVLADYRYHLDRLSLVNMKQNSNGD